MLPKTRFIDLVRFLANSIEGHAFSINGQAQELNDLFDIPTLIVTLSLLLMSLTTPVALADKLSKLDKIHLGIVEKYKQVDHVSDLPMTTAKPDEVILIDVREANEFAVSRIEGAVRVSPSISASDFLSQFGPDAEDKAYVFYCSVGRRSSELISRVQEGLFSEGASSIYNLEGGIFKWHNQTKDLVNQSGQTDYVHPYNFWWKRALDRPEAASYKPKS